MSKNATALAALTRAANAVGIAIPSGVGISLQGTAVYAAGSDQETFPITLAASGFDDAQITMQRAAGSVTELRHQGFGSWTGPDGVAHPFALHNTWTTGAWFFPALAIADWIGDNELIISDVGPSQLNGLSVEHIQCYRVPAGQMDSGTAALIQAASQMDLYLDSTSSLPVELDFNTHADANESVNVPVRIAYSGYQRVGPGVAPFRIQKYLNGSLLMDISINSVNLNAPALP